MSRVLFLAANLCSGGAERQMVTVACLLKKEGHDVTVYCYDRADFYADILRNENVPIIWELSPSNYLKRIRRVRRFIRKGNYDAVISFLKTCNFLNCISAVGGKKWRVITGERSAREFFFLSKKGRIFGWFQRYADAIVCNSNNAKKLWEQYYPRYSDKLFVIYNIVKLGNISSDYVPRMGNKLHIVVAATYQYLKNPMGLAKALLLMSMEERAMISVDWYGRKEIARGDKRAYEEVSSFIVENGLSDVFVLHEDTKDITDIMYQADTVMLLSEFEGLPNVICEAMSIGKPIIMTRVSDYDQLVDDTNGFLCNWDNLESIKDSILKMANTTDKELLEMGESSRRKALALFTEETVLEKWVSII